MYLQSISQDLKVSCQAVSVYTVLHAIKFGNWDNIENTLLVLFITDLCLSVTQETVLVYRMVIVSSQGCRTLIWFSRNSGVEGGRDLLWRTHFCSIP